MNNNQFNPAKFFDLSQFRFKDIFDGVGQVWEVIPKIEEYINDKFRSGNLVSNYNNTKNVFIGEGTVIEEGVVIKGPAIIGKDCHIGHVAYLRENCLIGDNVHIGHAVELKNSIMLSHATLAHFNYIGDSIVGNHGNISGGAMFANFRLDRKSVRVRTLKSYIETGMKKFGAAVGDNSIIGVNSVLNPGTVLGKNTIVYPIVSVRGVHPEKSILKTSNV